jgi:hypothetical protein
MRQNGRFLSNPVVVPEWDDAVVGVAEGGETGL